MIDPDPDNMEAMADALLSTALELAPQHKLDSLGMVMALSFASMKALFQIAEHQGMAHRGLEFAETVNATNLEAMAEMMK